MSEPEALSGMTTDELRAAVRAVLRDVLPALDAAPSPSTHDHPEQVVLRTDADLDGFVRRLATLCADPSRRAELQEGRHGFRLATAVTTGPIATGGGVLRIDKGAVTERIVGQAAADGASIVLGRGAVLTPLARDKARSLGVAVEKES